jgi:Cobalamin-independent synthase, Catalytic domain
MNRSGDFCWSPCCLVVQFRRRIFLYNRGYNTAIIHGGNHAMSHANNGPPFRAEHVGSFPRPERLLNARRDHSAGKLTKEDFKRTEADCIREIVGLQERVGIGAITDGEYPKTSLARIPV